MENEKYKKELVSLIKTADIGIEDVLLDEKDILKSVIEEMTFWPLLFVEIGTLGLFLLRIYIKYSIIIYIIEIT